MDYPTDFETYWEAIKPAEQYHNRRAATKGLWENDSLCPEEKRQAILVWLQKNGPWPLRNPYFFIQDFRLKKREPLNWNGHALEAGRQYVTAKWNGKWGTYTTEDVREFGMETKKPG